MQKTWYSVCLAFFALLPYPLLTETRSAMNKRRWLVTLCICALIFAGLATYKYLQISAAIAFGKSFPEPSANVEAVVAEKTVIDNTVTTIGEIIAPRTVDLRNELAGRVTSVNFHAGQAVKRGDILVQLDVLEEEARLKAAQANVKLAELELRRAKQLLKNKTVSQENVDQNQARFDIAQANVNELLAIISKKTITAPFDAVTGLHELDSGEYLQSNTRIVTLVGNSEFLWADFNVPLAQASLAIGDNVQVWLPSNNQRFNAQVIAKDSTISATSRNLRYRAKFLATNVIPANSVVDIAIPTAKITVFELPATALLKDELGDYVFILNKDSGGKGYRAERREVLVTRQNDQTVAIQKGLITGELVATHGAFKLRNNLLAYVKEQSNDLGKLQSPAQE